MMQCGAHNVVRIQLRCSLSARRSFGYAYRMSNTCAVALQMGHRRGGEWHPCYTYWTGNMFRKHMQAAVSWQETHAYARCNSFRKFWVRLSRIHSFPALCCCLGTFNGAAQVIPNSLLPNGALRRACSVCFCSTQLLSVSLPLHERASGCHYGTAPITTGSQERDKKLLRLTESRVALPVSVLRTSPQHALALPV